MRFLKVTFITLLVLLAFVFIIQNLEILRQAVTLKLNLHLAKWQTPALPLWLLVLFCFFLGVFTASLYGIYEIILQRQTIRQLKHNLEILAQELKSTGARAEEASAVSPEPKAAFQTDPNE